MRKIKKSKNNSDKASCVAILNLKPKYSPNNKNSFLNIKKPKKLYYQLILILKFSYM